jgi:hypothetical protein
VILILITDKHIAREIQQAGLEEPRPVDPFGNKLLIAEPAKNDN